MAEYPEIIKAIWKDDVDTIKSLLNSGSDVNLIDPDGRTPLMAAVIDKKIEITKILIDANADINYSDSGGWTALHFAAQEYSLEVSTMLVENGAKVDCRDLNGNTPLFRAIMNCRDDYSVLEFLIKSGASTDSVNEHGVRLKEIVKGQSFEHLFD